MNPIVFAYPQFFYLLILLIPMIVWYIKNHAKASASVQMSTLAAVAVSGTQLRVYLRHLLFVFRVLAIAALIVTLARPQSTNNWENVSTEGIDIMLAIDVSSSMLARDFSPDRLEAAKEVATQFISGRQLDRMGLVVFSGESFTQCPLTTDHAILINLMGELQSGMIEDGTAIGLGLANSINRLRESDAVSRVVILLTDGVNNKGDISPITAAEMAKSFGIRVYTIGVGTRGMAPYPVETPFGIQMQQMEVEIDEQMLQEVATLTEGKYFRATNKKSLLAIYEEIDKLEKSKIEVKEFSRKNDEFLPFALFAFALLLFEIVLRHTLLRNIP